MEEEELFPDALVLAAGPWETLTLADLRDYWISTGDVEVESTLVYEFVAWNTREAVGKTRGKNSYDVEWVEMAGPENERFPTLQWGYPRQVYEQYAECTPRIRLFMTLAICDERWKAGYCGLRARLKWL
jgi:hypothetical protein